MIHLQSHLHNLTPDSKKVLVKSLTFRRRENHNIYNSDLYKETVKNSGYSKTSSLCVYVNTWQTTLGTLLPTPCGKTRHLFSFFSWLYKKSQRTHFEWHKIVFLHQQDESQKAIMMWKEKEKAVLRQLTQELD